MKRTSKIIVVLAVLIAGSMIATAALVPYLSNKVEAEIEVSSPMVTKISLGKESWATTKCWRPAGCPAPAYWEKDCEDYPGEMVYCFPDGEENSALWGDTITIPDIRGGETVTIYTMSANLAKADISGLEECIVRNWAGVTSADFVSVVVRTDSIYGGLGYGESHDLIALGECHQLDADHVYFGSTNSLWGMGETDVTEIVVTFKTNAFGTYTFTYQVVPAI